MHDFAEEYVANLKPRDERYDTRLGDDFYVSTFPNGVKTWIYLYEVDGYTRRQTLGIYPEMPLETALESLYVARRTRSVEKELMSQGLDGSGMTREAEDSPINLTATRGGSRFAKLDLRFILGSVAGAVVTGVVALGIHLALMPTPQAATASAATATAAPGRAATPAGQQQVAAAAPAAEVSEAALTETQLELMQMQEAMTGTLAWSQLTSGIVRGEPVDDLGWIVEVENKPRRVFFFVRVRGMSGETVHYNWHHEGELIKQDEVKVGDGWHSPAFSSVILDAAREGQWRVEVMDQEGESLGVEQFEARAPEGALLSRR